MGGSNEERGYGVAVNSLGVAYVTGRTESPDFPTQNPYQASNMGGKDAFVAKFSSSGSSLVYSTYLGGSADDGGHAIAVDSAGLAFITGSTKSTDFPTVNASQIAYGGGLGDAFVTKFSSSGTKLKYSTYLGGSGGEDGFDIMLGNFGVAYVTGRTGSSDFPTVDAYQDTASGNNDAFVAKFVTNRAPVAEIKAPSSVCGTPAEVVLSGEDSYDPDGRIVSYLWSLVTEPSGSSAHIEGKDEVEATLHANAAGRYTVSLKVRDNEGEWSSAALKVIVVSYGEEARLSVEANRGKERAWIVEKDYAEVRINLIQATGCEDRVVVLKIKRISDGQESELKEVRPSQFSVQGGKLIYDFYDKYLEEGRSYTYRIEAYDSEGVLLLIGEVTI